MCIRDSINDEHDDFSEQPLQDQDDGLLIIDGNNTIRDLNRARDWKLRDYGANTIAGLVIHEAQIIPTIGQVFIFHGFRMEIMDRKGNRITKLKINPAKDIHS